MEYSLREGDNSDPGVWYRVLLIISAVLMAFTIYAVFIWVPTEVNLGVSQRIFYAHVPLAWLGMLSIVIVAVCAFVYLLTGNSKWDSLAQTYGEKFLNAWGNLQFRYDVDRSGEADSRRRPAAAALWLGVGPQYGSDPATSTPWVYRWRR